MRRLGPLLALLVVIVALARLGGAGASSSGHKTAASGIHKITHIVIIMQENRSFGCSRTPVRERCPPSRG
jgi:phospholipase C